MAHKSTMRSFLQINTINDVAQGTPNSNPVPSYILMPLQFASFERGFSSEDVIEDDDINSGFVWLTQSDLNFGHPTLKCNFWPNATELHHLLVWFMRRVPAGAPAVHSFPMAPADNDLTTTRQVIASNSDVQFKGHGILPNLEIKFGRKGKLTATCDIPLMNKASDVTAKASRSTGVSLWRRHVTLTALGGNLVVSELTMKLTKAAAAVPPAFGSASYNTLQFDEQGLFSCEISATGYAGEGFDPSTIQEGNTPIDFSSGFTFNDGTKSFALTAGNLKLTSYGDADNDGSRMWTLEGKMINRSGTFLSLSALA